MRQRLADGERSILQNFYVRLWPQNSSKRSEIGPNTRRLYMTYTSTYLLDVVERVEKKAA
jgi:hypothetical protein